jgi:glutaredoxin
MIRVYSITDCPYCSEIKELLTNENIPFVDVNIYLPENQKESDKLFEFTKTDQVPVLIVNKKILLPDVSFKTINDCFEIVKKLISEESELPNL